MFILQTRDFSTSNNIKNFHFPPELFNQKFHINFIPIRKTFRIAFYSNITSFLFLYHSENTVKFLFSFFLRYLLFLCSEVDSAQREFQLAKQSPSTVPHYFPFYTFIHDHFFLRYRSPGLQCKQLSRMRAFCAPKNFKSCQIQFIKYF